MKTLSTTRLLDGAARLLVRHCAHSDVGERLTGRGPESGLTQDGQVEAAILAERLAAEPVTAVYASPRRRTRETAEAIADRHGLEVVVADALDEIDFGEWTGRSFAELDGQPAWDRWNTHRAEAQVPAGETMTQALERARAFIGQAGGEGTLVFVTHCDIIRALLCEQDGRSLDGIFDYDVPPASVTPLRLPMRDRVPA